MPKQKYIPNIFEPDPDYYLEVVNLPALNAELKKDIENKQFDDKYHIYLDALIKYQTLINEYRLLYETGSNEVPHVDDPKQYQTILDEMLTKFDKKDLTDFPEQSGGKRRKTYRRKLKKYSRRKLKLKILK